MKSAADYFRELREEQQTRVAVLRRRYGRLAVVRLFVFFGWVALLIFLVSTVWWWGVVAFLLSVPLFAYGIGRHRAIAREAELASAKVEVAERELAALRHDFAAFDGEAPHPFTDHPYALDLDLFGDDSLLQFLNRTVTHPGKARLVRQLTGPVKEEERARTQVRSKEWAAEPDWCVTFRALGEGLADRPEYFSRLIEWLKRPPVVSNGPERHLVTLSPLFTLGGLAWMLTMSPWQLGVLAFLPALYLIRKYREPAATEHAYTAQTARLLKGYAELMGHLEHHPRGNAGTRGATGALRKLAYRAGQLDLRYNPFVVLLEIGGLWSLRWLRSLDRWRAEHTEDLLRWLEQLAEADALVSWATLRFERPHWAEMEVIEKPLISSEDLGHPLIDPAVRVGNDLHLATDGHIQLVTGSNMAGKSTWLRTVGVNLVLGMAGGPVCARHLRTRPLQVWTSLRTHDDLSEQTSSFYAELKRLRAIIGAVADPGRPVFFLLDEILKGTNSRDRHTGSRALIRQLIRERGSGIIATHDLELAELAAEPGSRVENFAMEVRVEGEELVFDYRLRPGVCQSFNATALMARMGIEIPPDEISLRHD